MASKVKLTEFLKLVSRPNGWRDVPPIWNEQIRQSLNDGLVTVGFGGVLKLTDAGRALLSSGKTGE